MRYIEPHGHMVSRKTDDYRAGQGCCRRMAGQLTCLA